MCEIDNFLLKINTTTQDGQDHLQNRKEISFLGKAMGKCDENKKEFVFVDQRSNDHLIQYIITP